MKKIIEHTFLQKKEKEKKLKSRTDKAPAKYEYMHT